MLPRWLRFRRAADAGSMGDVAVGDVGDGERRAAHARALSISEKFIQNNVSWFYANQLAARALPQTACSQDWPLALDKELRAIKWPQPDNTYDVIPVARLDAQAIEIVELRTALSATQIELASLKAQATLGNVLLDAGKLILAILQSNDAVPQAWTAERFTADLLKLQQQAGISQPGSVLKIP